MGPLFRSPQKIKYDAAGAVVIFEGNSLMAGIGLATEFTLPQQVRALGPLNGMAVTNLGVSGSTWNDLNSMTARAGAVDALYAPGKSHVLVLWEDTNTPWNDISITGEDCALQGGAYIAARKAAMPGLKVVKLTTISRYGVGGPYGTDLVAANNTLAACDAYTKANWRDLGIDALVDVRASGTFEMSGTIYMKQSMKPYITDQTHLNAAGYGLVAQQVATALRHLSAR